MMSLCWGAQQRGLLPNSQHQCRTTSLPYPLPSSCSHGDVSPRQKSCWKILARIRNQLGGIQSHLARLTSLQGKQAGAWVQALPTTGFLVIQCASAWACPFPTCRLRGAHALTVAYTMAFGMTPHSLVMHCDAASILVWAFHMMQCGTWCIPSLLRHASNLSWRIAPFSPLCGRMSTAMTRPMLSIGPWMLWWWTRSSQGTMDLDSSRVAAAGAEQASTHYANALPRHENVVLQPLALETMGAMGERFQEILCNCAKNRRHYMRVSEDDMTRIIQAMVQTHLKCPHDGSSSCHLWSCSVAAACPFHAFPHDHSHSIRLMLYWSGLSLISS